MIIKFGKQILLAIVFTVCCSEGFSQLISEHDLETSIYRDARHIARRKVNIWLKIYQSRFSFISKTRIGNFRYSPEECDLNKLTAASDSTVAMQDLGSVYLLSVDCINQQKQITYELLFSFNVLGEFTEILICDLKTNIQYRLFQDDAHCCNNAWFK